MKKKLAREEATLVPLDRSFLLVSLFQNIPIITTERKNEHFSHELHICVPGAI
jgi:hypothetical protein